MIKPKISQTIVVEGKSDVTKILNLFDVNIITTNGSDCNQETLDMIKQANEYSGVILFLDPDYVGEQIRKKITNYIPNLKQAFIDKSDIKIGSKKIGIAEASDEAIINALEHVVTFTCAKESLSQSEYDQLNLNSKVKRLKLCKHYRISYCNNKQLLKRLNMMNLNYSDLVKVIKNEDIK